VSKSVKIDAALWRRIERLAQTAGYSSPEEFISHALEKELSRHEEAASQDELDRRLKGLGYIE